MTTETNHAQKFTVSVPRYLYEEAERERVRLGMSRSDFVASLYRSYLREAERERKIARYKAAYERLPASPEEDALTQESTELMLTGPT